MALFLAGMSIKTRFNSNHRKKQRHFEKRVKILDPIKQTNFEPGNELPTTIDVLKEHLLAKVREVFPECSESYCQKWEAQIVHDEKYILDMLQNKDLLIFESQKLNRGLTHCDTDGLTANVDTSCPHDSAHSLKCSQFPNPVVLSEYDHSQEYAEELFQKVSDIEPSLCAQITGMILELDDSTVQKLLGCDDELTAAVAKAKNVYLNSVIHDTCDTERREVVADTHDAQRRKVVTDTCDTERREVVAERVYEQVLSLYPDKADKITGMLLEADIVHLEELLSQGQQLRERIDEAYECLRVSS